MANREYQEKRCLRSLEWEQIILCRQGKWSNRPVILWFCSFLDEVLIGKFCNQFLYFKWLANVYFVVCLLVATKWCQDMVMTNYWVLSPWVISRYSKDWFWMLISRKFPFGGHHRLGNRNWEHAWMRKKVLTFWSLTPFQGHSSSPMSQGASRVCSRSCDMV